MSIDFGKDQTAAGDSKAGWISRDEIQEGFKATVAEPEQMPTPERPLQLVILYKLDKMMTKDEKSWWKILRQE